MNLIRSRNLSVILIADVLLLCLSFYLAHLIRFEFIIGKNEYDVFSEVLPCAVIIKMMIFFYMDLYQGMWRYTGLNSMIGIFKAVFLSSVLLVFFVWWKYRFQGVSRSVFFIDFCLTLIFVGGSRVVIRMFHEQFAHSITARSFGVSLFNRLTRKQMSVKRVVIIGAGDCAEKIFREIKDNTDLRYRVVGFLDDDPAKLRKKIHGTPVIGRIKDIGQVVNTLDISDIIIAIPSVSALRMREVVDLCKKSGVHYRTVPGMGELINGKVSVNTIRDVEYRDLLGRTPVDLEIKKIGAYLGNRTVLVTGAGGSIGTGLCRQICRFAPDRIVLFERAESPLYEIDLELKKNFPNIEVIPLLGDIQKKEEVVKVFKDFGPEIVFHAAAYKHVPMLEMHPWKAVENNIIGTENLVEVADRYLCEKFVFISTDKAVNPANIMGTSKRISEMIVQNRSLFKQSQTQFVTVRFGNVIGSAGSVIPLFKNQIKQGGPITVTHPDVIRYFMLIPEACQLILQAGAMGRGGEIFILDMGEPVNIAAMAKDLIRFSGLEPDIDIKIEYIGLRPGEKLYEELMTDDENVVPTDHEQIMILNCCQVDMNMLNGKLDRLKQAAVKRDPIVIKSSMKEIVPEYEECESAGLMN